MLSQKRHNMQLFYHPEVTHLTKQFVFEKEESRHIAKVLRKKEGDRLHLTNGKGYFFTVELLSSMPKQCVAQVLTAEKQSPLPYSLHLVVAPTKLNDRYEWFLEKATEIGVSEITPILCDNSERKVIKTERYEKIILGAMKQSLKAHLPILNPMISFKEFISSEKFGTTPTFIAHCKGAEKQSLKSVKPTSNQITILIGPEGDFSEKEIEMALQKMAESISLGESRLRTETAAIVACHSIAYNYRQ